MPTQREINEVAAEIAKRLADAGKLCEAGATLYATTVHPDASDEMKFSYTLAFMAGCQHLFASIMGVLEDDSEPTDMDMARMDNISRELESWRARLEELVNPTQGKA